MASPFVENILDNTLTVLQQSGRTRLADLLVQNRATLAAVAQQAAERAVAEGLDQMGFERVMERFVLPLHQRFKESGGAPGGTSEGFPMVERAWAGPSPRGRSRRVKEDPFLPYPVGTILAYRSKARPRASWTFLVVGPVGAVARPADLSGQPSDPALVDTSLFWNPLEDPGEGTHYEVVHRGRGRLLSYKAAMERVNAWRTARPE